MIFFDLDDTLYDQMTPFRKAFGKVFHDEKFQGVDLNTLFEHRQTFANKAYGLFLQGELSKKEMLCYRLTRAFKAMDMQISNQQALDFQLAYQDFQLNIELDEAMEKVLDYCVEQEISIAILSNGETKHQWDKVERLNLKRWFPEECIFVSGTMGYDKPDTRLFEEIEERLALSKEEACLIGDNYQNDIVGAGRAGWRSVFLNKYDFCQPESLVADYEIEKTSELLNLIDRLVSVNV